MLLKRLISKLVPRAAIFWVERAAARSDILANLYYAAFSHFSREHRGVLYGKTVHLSQLINTKDADGSRHTLRRNIHRLEKGLIMRPRRDVFAREYIGETVALFGSLVNDRSANGEDTQLLREWATDVLDRYFEVTGSHPAIDSQRERFRAILAEKALCAGSCRPYKRDLTPMAITYDDLLQLARRRRSCRWYLQKPVPREIIDRAVAVAAQSPSACNRQPFEFRIFDEPALARKVGAIPGGTIGFSENFPCIAVVIGKLRAFPLERDRHVPYIDGGLASMAFQFALEVQGVSSCCINFPDIPRREAAMAEALGLEPDERPIMLISFGYPDPDAEVPFSQKKSLDELRAYNRYKDLSLGGIKMNSDAAIV